MVETLEKFKNRWKKKAEEIKKQVFDRNQCFNIMSDFLEECMVFHVYRQNDSKTPLVPEFEEIRNDLGIALEIAYSNYRKQKRGFWSKIFGGKKELNLFKYK